MLLTACRRPIVWILTTAFLCLFSSAVFAQAVSDPNIAEFSPSADHNAVGNGALLVERYSLAFYTLGGSQPVLTVNLGKPSLDPDGKIRVNFRSLVSSLPASGVTYEARVSAVGPTGATESLSSNQFSFTATPGGAVTFSVSPSAVNMGINLLGGTTRVTTSQQVIITQGAGSPVNWTIGSNSPWVVVSPASGSGSALVNVSYNSAAALPANGSRATLTITAAGASPRTVQVTLSIVAAPAAPFGVVDTPLDNTGGVTGSIAVTGWALDDIDVARVRVMRDPIPGEGTARVFLGDAVLVNGARPDLVAHYPLVPHNGRAGWGLLVLTNMLPNQGNGTFRLHAYAEDMDGHSTLLGSRTITCTNSTATAPFGAIDTPGQGETVSGTSYNNFGWVLARGARRADPPGGGSVQVVIDGAFVGSPFGWTSRSDLSSIFPVSQYSGIARAAGVYGFNTTTLANGVHTISWVVTDNMGTPSGIGSRYFSVLNAAGLTAAATSAVALDGQSVVIAGPPAQTVGASTEQVSSMAARSYADATPIAVRRGFSPDTPFRRVRSGADGRFTVQAEELDRIELGLTEEAGQTCSGYSSTAGLDAALPVGSNLDAASCVFTWQPGVGFVGAYDFVFVRDGASGTVRQDVRIVLNAKRSGLVGPQVVIDIPSAHQVVGPRFVIGGWAVDLDADTGTGVDTLHVWAYPAGACGPREESESSSAAARASGGGAPRAMNQCGAPQFVGVASYGGSRPDVSAIYGAQFRTSGFGLEVSDLAPGTYDLAVFAWSRVTRGFVPASVARMTVALPKE